jgi:hypothetical protein
MSKFCLCVNIIIIIILSFGCVREKVFESYTKILAKPLKKNLAYISV